MALFWNWEVLHLTASHVSFIRKKVLESLCEKAARQSKLGDVCHRPVFSSSSSLSLYICTSFLFSSLISLSVLLGLLKRQAGNFGEREAVCKVSG